MPRLVGAGDDSAGASFGSVGDAATGSGSVTMRDIVSATSHAAWEKQGGPEVASVPSKVGSGMDIDEPGLILAVDTIHSIAGVSGVIIFIGAYGEKLSDGSGSDPSMLSRTMV